MAKVQRPLGDVGTRFLFENERVKVWSLVLEPGKASPWHHHTMDYITVVSEAGTLRVEFNDGTLEERRFKLGDVNFRPKHSIHRVTNTGKTRYGNAIIELKE